MVPETFDRETLLDLVVNGVPLAMLAAFTLLFVAVAPYGFDPVATTVQLALVLVPFAALVVLSYYAAKAVERDEAAVESTPAAFAEPQAAAANADPDVEYATVVAGTGHGDRAGGGDERRDRDELGPDGTTPDDERAGVTEPAEP